MQAVFVLALLGVVVALLVSERLRPDVVAMIALAALVAARVLPFREALSGFSSPATITVAAIFVLSAGLQGSGLVRLVADRLLRHGPSSELGLMLVLVLTIAPISAFINNTAAVVVFMPIVISACHAHGISPSRLLMPMVFLAILGGTCTIIGTSTNVLVSSMAADRGLPPFGLFEITPLGLIFLAVGALYLVLAGRRLLPARVKAQPLVQAHELAGYLSEVVVLGGSPLAGMTLREARLAEDYRVQVLGVVDERGEVGVVPEDGMRLIPRQVLLIKAPVASLPDLAQRAGLVIKSSLHPEAPAMRSLEAAMVEVVIVPGSALIGSTVKDADFRNRYGATALAIRRQGEELREKVGRVRLRLGDEILVLVRRGALPTLRLATDFAALEEVEVALVRPVRAAVSLLIMVGVVVTAAAGWMPIAGSAFVGGVLMLLSGCLPRHKLYRSIDWQVILLLAGVIPLGAALESSGAADLVVRLVLGLVGDLGPRAVLGAFVVMTYALTGIMSNNATAALMFPLALNTANRLGIDERPLLIAIMFAASAAFWTPFGYQTNLLVYAPGGYRFTDYTRVGGPLNLIYAVLSVLLIPLLFPFR